MDDFSAVVAKDDQGVEKLECRGCDNEHVDRGYVAHVVAQEAAPGRGGHFGSPRHGPPDSGLADFNAEFEQFAVDAGCAPQRIRHAHLAYQITDLCARLRTTNLARS